MNFRDNLGQIVNRSVADGVGLEVATGKSLALVGGNISLEGGILTASEGNIELGSVAGNSIVTLEENSSGFDFQYEGITNFGNIELTQGAIVDSSGEGSGSINLQGNQISLQDGSQIRAATLGSVPGEAISVNAETLLIEDGASISSTTIGEGDAGDINIEVSQSIEIVGTGFDDLEQNFVLGIISGTFDLSTPGTGLFTGSSGSASSGAINIETTSLRLREGAVLSSPTEGIGNSGDISIQASQSVEVDSSLINSVGLIGSTGVAGDIQINTRNLVVSDGGQINSSTLGQGAAGNITVTASDSVELLRSPEGIIIQTGIFPTSTIGEGKAGDLVVDTSRLIIQDGAGLASASGGIIGQTILSRNGGQTGNLTITATESIEISGVSEPLADGNRIPSFISNQTSTRSDSGNITIDTNKLVVKDGGLISAATLDAGDAGNITINALESVEVSGAVLDGEFSSTIEASSGRAFSIEDANATGNAGSLFINTGNLSISNSGLVSVEGLGSGDAGILDIQANDIQLDNQGQIVAETVFGAGGNITLDVDERLTLRNNSLISAKAKENANGGNIDIDTNFIVAFPNQNNDILASAEQGRGGNINITAEALFGIEGRPQNPITNDIDASSEFGLDGTIAIVTPDINPLQRDVEVPINLLESEQTFAQACQSARASDKPSGLTIKGKGGIPPVPTEPFDSETILVGEQITTRNLQARYPEIKPIKTSMGDIYPARGVIKTEDGKVILTRYPTDNINTRTPHISANCTPS